MNYQNRVKLCVTAKLGIPIL